MKVNINKILRKGKALFLAYDQGLEHGPMDFNDKNVNPEYIIEIAKKGKFNAIIFQKGIAEKYKKEIKKAKLNLILKLNGKTSFIKKNPISRQLCTINEAINLGADAVGYTIYLGSKREAEMFQEFENIEREAHKKGLPVILWVYPSSKKKENAEFMAYSARIGLELGADIIKIKYFGSKEDLKWAVKSAGKAKIVIAGGIKKQEAMLLKQIKDIIDTGCIGLAIGRNIWQSKNPMKLTEKIRKVIWK